MRDQKLFDEALARFFKPLAQKIGLPLCKVQNGSYEVRSPFFIMRVRLDTGHARGLNVLLRPASLHEFHENKPGSEYGIANFMLLLGENPKRTFIDINRDEDFVMQAQLLASAAELLLVPLLLGNADTFSAVEDFVRKRTAKDAEKIEQYRFSRNVRKEWL